MFENCVQELAAPSVEEPDKGFFIPNIDLTPLCSPKYRSSATNDDAQVLTCNLNDLVKDSNWIDLKQLCIAKEKLVWTLYCDITCVDYDGSVLDASVVALSAALRSRKLCKLINDFFYRVLRVRMVNIVSFFAVTLPKIQYDHETSNYTVHKLERIPLELSEECPVCTTAMIFDEYV